jgi:putative NADH-flavin reductase
MKLAVFGATGNVGSAALDQALDEGHEVRVLARTPAKVRRTDPALTVLAGNAKDPDAVAATIAGCDAVMSALGGPRDPDSIRIGTTAIVAAMGAAGIRRLVVMQGFHLDFPGDPHNLGRAAILPLLWLFNRDLIPDSRAMAAMVQESDADWTVVRAPRVVVAARTGRYRTGQLALGPWNSVTSGDVADVMLACLRDPTTVRTAPMVCRASARHGAVAGAR